MPEIKNTFTQGKMNKDLDERLVPNGQYRDAMNVQLSTSDGSDIGTVQNILGNKSIENVVDINDAKCVGSVSDEGKNRLFWFIKSNYVDAIIEYSVDMGVSAVLVDTKANTSESVLKFPNNIITGINVFDNLLLWTDNTNEPRRINIDRCKKGNPAITSLQTAPHTKLIVQDVDEGDIKEDHITVIKKSPLKPLSYTILPSSLDNKKPLFEKIFPRFSYRYKYIDGEYSTFAPFTDAVFNSLYSEDLEGDPYNQNNAYGTEDPYNNGMRNMINSVTLYNFIAGDMPKDVVEVDLLYKQENSTVIYILENIKNDSSYWNNDGSNASSSYKGSFEVKTENIYAAVPENQSLRIWDNSPKSALAQEVTGNRVVYANYKQGYDLLDQNNNSLTPVSRASYVNRNILEDSYDFEKGGIPSLKSQRDYQVGVVYGDKYGRETPVFTNEDSSFKTIWEDASSSNQIEASLSTTHPKWADYYKFFVKETSGEYYNLIMDAVYTPTVEDLDEINEKHVWLSFPSSDRNKISTEDYMSVKRFLDPTVTSAVSTENKYKVLDVQNEAPEAIKYKYLRYGNISNDNDDLNSLFFTDATLRPVAGSDYIMISKTAYLNHVQGKGMNLTLNEPTGASENIGDLYIKFTRTSGDGEDQTDRYKVNNVRVSGTTYLIKLEKGISTTDAAIIIDEADPANPDFKSDVNMVIDRKVVKNLEAFSGRFFVKISRRGVVGDLQDAEETELINRVTEEKNIYWHADVRNTTDYNPTTGIINSDSEHTNVSNSTLTTKTVANISSNITNTETGWDTILTAVEPASKFFIDNMYFAASQPNLTDEAYARYSGHGWKGGTPSPIGDIRYPTWQGLNILGDNTADFAPPLPSHYEQQGFGTSNQDRRSVGHPNINVVKPNDPGDNGENMINGMDGIIKTDVNQIDGNGIKKWKKNVAVGYTGNSTYYQNDYGNVSGKQVIHLSFLGPGADLHNGNFISASTLSGRGANGLARQLQGIFGGGVFTNENGFNIRGENSILCEQVKNGLVTKTNNPGTTTGSHGKEGYGTTTTHLNNHLRQWLPEWSGGNYNADVKRVIDRLQGGVKFRFEGDTDRVFTIESVKVKRLYNHTSWRKIFKWDGVANSGNVVTRGDSVEDAAVAWGNTAPGATATGLAGDLYTKIKDFGKRNNRRVCYIITLTDDSPDIINGAFNPVDGNENSGHALNSVDFEKIQFIDPGFNLLSGNISQNPAIWETEPKENVDLDIYYEAGQACPITLTDENRELFAPVGCRVEISGTPSLATGDPNVIGSPYSVTFPSENNLSSWADGNVIVLDLGVDSEDGSATNLIYNGIKVKFIREDGSYTTGAIVDGDPATAPTYALNNRKEFEIRPLTETGLGWYNCFSFGNGIESNRIRDDFNAMKISNGVIANSTLDRLYAEEHRKNGLVYSGIYNSTNSINNLNQFIAAEKITKDLNPTYGSIQKLFSRRISLIAFCEDRVVGITANKNALYNADGNPQIVASNAVLGDANPFVGDYGISKNPESFAKDSYRAYFTDKQRGAVLRLSMDGLTPISDAGMHDYFRDNLKTAGKLIGVYDDHKEDYNLTLTDFLPENVIVNGLIEEGEGGSTESFNTAEIVIDGGFSNGTNVTLPSTPANIANNSDLDSDTIITNYPEITQGSLQAEQEEKVAYNWSFDQPTTPHTIIYHTIEDTNYGDFFSVPVGENTDKASEAMWDFQNYGQGFNATNSGHHPYLKNANGSGTGQSSIWAKTQNLNSDLVDPEVSGVNNTNPTTSSNPNYFANAIDSTIFHKEEYKVTFTVQNYLNPNDTTHHSQTGGSPTDNYIDLQVLLWSNQILNYGNYTTSTMLNFHSDGTTPYFADGIETVSTAEDYNAGWLTSNTHTFNDVPLTNSKTFSFHFMLEGEEGVEIDTLTDPSNNMLLSPIANYFNIRFYNDKSNLSRNSVIIRELKIEKTRKVTSPGNNFSQPYIPAEPPADVLAWAEVEHVAVNDWSANANIILNDFAIDKYGPDTGSGTTVTYDTYDYSTGVINGTDTYIDGTPNNDTTYNEYADGNYPEDGYLEATTNGAGGATAFLTQDISANPLVIDNWYEVRLVGVNTTGNDGVLVSNALDPNSFPTGWAIGGTLPGHLGTISAGSSKSIKFSDEGSGEWIARWQQKDTSGDLNELKIHFYDFSATVDRIEFAEIYDTVNSVGKVTGGTVDDWTINNPNASATGNYITYHYYSPRKKVYYHGNAIRWGYDSTWRDATPTGFVDVGGEDNNYALQAVSIPVTNDGYELRFQTSVFDAGQGPGVNTGSLQGYVTGGFEDVDTGHTYGFEFDGIEQGGYYKVTGNLDGATNPTIERVLSDYITPAGSTGSLTVGIKDFSGPGHADKVLFTPTTGSFFKGRLVNVSLKDATNYFTTTNAESWLFDGFDPNFEDYIVFDDVNENILFTDAPNTVSLQQNIAHNFTTGSTVQLKFDAIGITSGSISGYFYNNEGEGFTFGPINADTNFDSEDNPNNRITIGDSTVTGGELLNTFVAYVDTEYFSGTLDNFELYRIYPEFMPSTITYSEDVKGWVSFKSFMPESGVSLSKEHYTMKEGKLWVHHIPQFDSYDKEINRNTFYDQFIESSITTVLNAEPSTIKIYNTLNYEGTQSKINLHTTKDVLDAGGNTVTLSNVEMYNLKAKDGWYVGSITTDKQSGSIKEFVEKEGKWFNYIKGTGITDTTLPSTADLSFQGLGMVDNVISNVSNSGAGSAAASGAASSGTAASGGASGSSSGSSSSGSSGSSGGSSGGY